MKGGYLHNQCLAGLLVKPLQSLGACVYPEYPVEPGRHPRSVDLFIELAGHRLVVEAETDGQRADKAPAKARALGAQSLCIVVPTAAVARAARRRLKQIRAVERQPKLKIVVLTIGAALQQVTNKRQFVSALFFDRTTVHQLATDREKAHP